MSELIIHLKSSRQFVALLCFTHFSAACILWEIDWTTFIRLIGTVLLAISLYLYLRYHALLLSSQSIVSFYLSSTDASTCKAQTQSNEHIIFTIKSDTFVTPYLTVLSLKSPHSIFSRNIVIFPDGIDVEKFRQLRIWLRWKWRKK
ncbi:protein YgfX [Nitrosomonas sp. Nm132]|jgi:toxin CptA|uniref:protein YgfX n=1 Tax=Nitrosomonas sp. Nm132 TaxID=1881053 RepID=UPI00088D6A80|nr:toxin CptA [Nitrosomonas sp. Nm132]